MYADSDHLCSNSCGEKNPGSIAMKCHLTSIFEKSMLNDISIEISIFQIFYRNVDFQNFENFEILKINFLQDEKIFFVRIFFNCLGMFFHSPKHAFRALMIPSERCYSA